MATNKLGISNDTTNPDSRFEFLVVEPPPNPPPAPLGVQFTDQSLRGSGPAISSWLWNFGEGTASNDKDPLHRYAALGTYTVSLTVRTASGNDTELKTGYVVVDAIAPAARFTANTTSGPAHLTYENPGEHTVPLAVENAVARDAEVKPALIYVTN